LTAPLTRAGPPCEINLFLFKEMVVVAQLLRYFPFETGFASDNYYR
jgi:hypothetical protein